MSVPDLAVLPATDPTTLLRCRDGIYAADFLACAIVHLDLFTRLADHPATLEEICTDLAIHERPADVMLTLCRARGLLESDGEHYRVTELAREHLVGGSPWSLQAYYASLEDRPVVKEVLGVLRSGNDLVPLNWASLDVRFQGLV
jgi:hypothetical protein